MTETVLIVDDDDIFRQTLSRSLERRGFATVDFSGVEAALAKIHSLHIDKAVIDLKMGSETGLRLIPALREQFPKASILMLTGYASIATAVDAIKLGADNYLQKPAGTKAILEALESKDKAATEVRSDEQAIASPSLDRLTWEYIQRALNDNDGNVSATARQLGMHRRTLQRKLQKRPVKE
ncbi:response regulator [Spongiibacter sp. KMU-158]|uniref:Response regulator n=1 Tax=Spongiibacter pelagi TaxID=2760804 RepID=A0A927C2I0_9GAMM|nr:response regulator [Spongiibacter pelagi]MBD2858832.1 response regulator [Spongiibacter pelagi]